MTETILLLPGVNGTELIRMMARFQKNSLGLRIMNATEFARFALMRSGIVLEESFLPRKQEAAMIDAFIREEPYFASAGYADSEKIADTLYSLRSLIAEQEWDTIHNRLPEGEFPDKNRSLVTVYEQYLTALKNANNTDTIGLLRKALAEATPLTCPVYTLKEYPLSPLEEALLNRLSTQRTDSDLQDFMKVAAVPLHNIDYTKSYGSSNEVTAIYDYILANKLPFDECIVAAANTAQYSQLFYDFSQSHDLPITLGCGIPILNANPARLLKLLYDWNNSGYHGVDALGAMLRSDALDHKKLLSALGISEQPWLLDEIIEVAGQLRVDFDRAENNKKLLDLPRKENDEAVYNGVAALAAELALGESKLLERYALIRKDAVGRVDRSALSVICEALDAYAKYAGGSSLNKIIPSILQRSVCSENSRGGALFVTGLSGALVSMRKHLFVVGLSATNFPGMPRENYLLLDSDYLIFANKNQAPTSVNQIIQKKVILDNLLALASSLDVNIHLSYSGYNLADMKEENPSSVLFEIYKQQHSKNATLQKYESEFRSVGYFEQQVTGDYPIGLAYIAGKQISYDNLALTGVPCLPARAFSPTAIEEYFKCPWRFYLTKILGAKQPEEDDPIVVIDHLKLGTLAHALMKGLADSPCDQDTFLQRADAAFDAFLKGRPPIHQDAAAKEKKVFLRMMKYAYEKDPGNKVVFSEEKKSCVHSTGILLEGYPDRVEKIGDDDYIIADYKTGKNIAHKENDIDTCLQAVIYAYMLEQQGVHISECQYRYLRSGQTIRCRYDDDMKIRLDAKLQELKNALDTGNFPYGGDKDVCKYCKLKHICDKQTDAEEDEE